MPEQDRARQQARQSATLRGHTPTRLGNVELTRFYSEKLLGQEQDTEQAQGMVGQQARQPASQYAEGKQHFLWQEKEEQKFKSWLSEEIETSEKEQKPPERKTEKSYLTPYLEALRRWKHPVTIDVDEIRKARLESLKPKE